jgi:hypothetical protein
MAWRDVARFLLEELWYTALVLGGFLRDLWRGR